MMPPDLHWAVRWARPCAILAAAAGFALHNGLEYGRGNHWQYLVHGLNAADPTFLQNDWFTTQTSAHHGAFNALVAFLSRHTRLNIALGLLSAAAAATFALALYWIVAALCDEPLIPFAAVLAMAAHMGTDGPGHSNILLSYFVPSVFSGVMLLAAFALLLRGRDMTAGLVAAIGCALHANYLVLVGPLWCLTLLYDRRRTWRRAGVLLIPWLLAWGPHLGMLFRVASPDGPVREARSIFWDIYAPLHYRPWTWPARQYADFLIVLAAGAAAYGLSRTGAGRRAWAAPNEPFPAVDGPVMQTNVEKAWTTAKAVFMAIATIVALGACGTILWSIDVVTAVYPWRLAPFITLGAFVCMGVSLALPRGGKGRGAGGPHLDEGDGSVSGTAAAWRMLPAILIVIGAIMATRMGQRCAGLVAVVAGGGWLIALAAGLRGAADRIVWRQWAGIGLVLVIGASLGRVGLWRTDRFGYPYKPPVEELFAWCRDHSARGTIFAIPPDLAGFRVETGRAVIVDWKCMPLAPEDQVEWLRRHERQAGRLVRCEADAIGGWASLDAERAASLRDEFGCRYVVVDLRRGSEAPGLNCVFKNGWYAVYEALARDG